MKFHLSVGRFRQWRDNGTFEQVLRHLHLRLREDGVIDLDTWMVDSTSIRATRAASGAAKKRGLQEPQHHCLRRSRGGLTTKIHLACDSHSVPLAIMLSPGEQADSRYFMPLLDQISLPGSWPASRDVCGLTFHTSPRSPALICAIFISENCRVIFQIGSAVRVRMAKAGYVTA